MAILSTSKEGKNKANEDSFYGKRAPEAQVNLTESL